MKRGVGRSAVDIEIDSWATGDWELHTLHPALVSLHVVPRRSEYKYILK